MLWVCGWISKKRAKNEGVFIPRGGITERGINQFMGYRAHEVEIYNQTLNGIKDLKEWYNDLTKEDVIKDETNNHGYFMQRTNADAQRILQSLLVRQCVTKEQYDKINESLGLAGTFIPPILHENHTFAYVRHLIREGMLDKSVLEKLQKTGAKETRFEDVEELKRFFD